MSRPSRSLILIPHCIFLDNHWFLPTSFCSKTTSFCSKTTSFCSKTTSFWSKTTSFCSKTTSFCSKTTSSCSKTTKTVVLVENDVVFEQDDYRVRARRHRPVRGRPTKKRKVMNHRWIKLIHHNGPNHPAKYGCLGVSSHKVGFSLVNRVSLIFKARGLTPANVGKKNFFTDNVTSRLF